MKDKKSTISDLNSLGGDPGEINDYKRITVDVRHLPVEKERRESLFLSIILLIVALACAVWLGIDIYFTGLIGSLPVSLILLALSVAFGYFGLSCLVQKEFIRITEEKVFYRIRDLWGYTQWEKPLPDFRGVLLTENKLNKEVTYYRVKLYAEDIGPIILFESEEKRAAYYILKQFAPALGLPALEQLEGQIIEHKP